jgi:hypothetical protein
MGESGRHAGLLPYLAAYGGLPAIGAGALWGAAIRAWGRRERARRPAPPGAGVVILVLLPSIFCVVVSLGISLVERDTAVLRSDLPGAAPLLIAAGIGIVIARKRAQRRGSWTGE